MYYLVAFIAGAMFGFVIGLFVYRNNAAKAELKLALVLEELRKAKEKAGL